jgi:hypothetical protein
MIMMKNLAIRTAVMAALATDGGSDESMERDGTTSDGTAVPERIKAEAKTILDAAWKLHEQIVSISSQLLAMAKKCAKAADGDPKLALRMYTAALADAEMHLEKEAKTKAEKAKVAEFLDPKGSWKQYSRTITGSMNDGLDITQYRTESALRAARKAAKDAAGHGGGNANQTPEQKAQAELKRVDGIAVIVAKDDNQIAEKVSLLLKAIKVVDLEEGANKAKILNVLNQALIAVNRLVPADTKVGGEFDAMTHSPIAGNKAGAQVQQGA